jgi:sRNA-binding protein
LSQRLGRRLLRATGSHKTEATASYSSCCARNFLDAFSVMRRTAKVGVHNDVLLVLGDAVTPSELGKALQNYVNKRIYQSRLRPGATRIDLNGEPAGTVTAREAAFARAKERARTEERPTPWTREPHRRPEKKSV